MARWLGIVGTALLAGRCRYRTPSRRSSRDRVRTRASRSCVPTTGTPSTSKPATSGTSSCTGRPGTPGSGTAGPSTFGERQRWFVYASFGHSAASLDNPVPPAEDERDNISNVTPHAQFAGNALYEYLPGLSRGTGEPQPTARLELTTVDLDPGDGQGVRGGPRRGAVHSCRARRSGIGWWRAEALRATSDCVRGPACRRFSMERSEQALPDAVNAVDREDDRRDPDSAADDELRPAPVGPADLRHSTTSAARARSTAPTRAAGS